MANYLNFPVTGGYSVVGAAADPGLDGDNLILVGSVASFSIATANPANAATSLTQITFNLSGTSAGSDTVIVTVGSTAAGTDPAGTAPFIATQDAAGSAAYNVILKAAIIKAIGANPGGVISTIVLPLAQASNAQYNFANTVYFKDFAIS
jgi:hypothetical protein|tara:strand:- start:428 stop:877 length:450 start_codon:yes stop_codon:yes gene_type:complete